jgi:hypothetical protein
VTPTEALPYRLVVPAAWTRLPMDPVGMRDAARAMLLRRFGALPRDETATLRREVEQELVALTRRAGSEYTRMLLVLALEVSRRPITASCLVSLLPRAVPDETALQALAVELSDGSAISAVEDFGTNRGVVVVRDQVMPMSPVPDGVDVAALAELYADAIGLRETASRQVNSARSRGRRARLDTSTCTCRYRTSRGCCCSRSALRWCRCSSRSPSCS